MLKLGGWFFFVQTICGWFFRITKNCNNLRGGDSKTDVLIRWCVNSLMSGLLRFWFGRNQNLHDAHYTTLAKDLVIPLIWFCFNSFCIRYFLANGFNSLRCSVVMGDKICGQFLKICRWFATESATVWWKNDKILIPIFWNYDTKSPEIRNLSKSSSHCRTHQILPT